MNHEFNTLLCFLTSDRLFPLSLPQVLISQIVVIKISFLKACYYNVPEIELLSTYISLLSFGK